MDIEVYKSLSDESRLRILNLLMRRELCVCEIEFILEMSQTNVSRHLNKLKNASIVTVKKKSKWAYYSICETFMSKCPKLYEHLQFSFQSDDQLKEDMNKLISLEKDEAFWSESNIIRFV